MRRCIFPAVIVLSATALASDGLVPDPSYFPTVGDSVVLGAAPGLNGRAATAQPRDALCAKSRYAFRQYDRAMQIGDDTEDLHKKDDVFTVPYGTRATILEVETIHHEEAKLNAARMVAARIREGRHADEKVYVYSFEVTMLITPERAAGNKPPDLTGYTRLKGYIPAEGDRAYLLPIFRRTDGTYAKILPAYNSMDSYRLHDLAAENDLDRITETMEDKGQLFYVGAGTQIIIKRFIKQTGNATSAAEVQIVSGPRSGESAYVDDLFIGRLESTIRTRPRPRR